MNAFELNKIAAAVLLAGVIAMTAGLAANLLVSQPHHVEPVIVATGAEAPAAAGGGEEELPPIAALMADASAEAGQKAAAKCTSCHTFEKGGANKVGPNLYGVLGADIAFHEGYSYSSALTGLEGQWDYEKLNHFLFKPRAFAPGTKMSFAGLSRPQERADMIAYLRSMHDDPPALPDPGTAAAEGAAEPQAAPAEGAAAQEGQAQQEGGAQAEQPGPGGQPAAPGQPAGGAGDAPRGASQGDATGGGSSTGLGAQSGGQGGPQPTQEQSSSPNEAGAGGQNPSGAANPGTPAGGDSGTGQETQGTGPQSEGAENNPGTAR